MPRGAGPANLCNPIRIGCGIYRNIKITKINYTVKLKQGKRMLGRTFDTLLESQRFIDDTADEFFGAPQPLGPRAVEFLLIF